MPWYTITWFDFHQIPIKREILHRHRPEKVTAFCARRILNVNLHPPEGAISFLIGEAQEMHLWDYDAFEPTKFEPRMHAIEIELSDTPYLEAEE